MSGSRIASTGYEFAKESDLNRDEAWARSTGNRSLLLRILRERQQRRWSDEQRSQFATLRERWYKI